MYKIACASEDNWEKEKHVGLSGMSFWHQTPPGMRFLLFPLPHVESFWCYLFTSSADVMRKTRQNKEKMRNQWFAGGLGGGWSQRCSQAMSTDLLHFTNFFPRSHSLLRSHAPVSATWRLCTATVTVVMLNLNWDVDYEFRNGVIASLPLHIRHGMVQQDTSSAVMTQVCDSWCEVNLLQCELGHIVSIRRGKRSSLIRLIKLLLDSLRWSRVSSFQQRILD